MNKQKIKFKRAAFLDIHSPLYLRSKKSKYCGGDIGELYSLIDLAADAGFQGVQFTPVQDTGHYSCPYMGISIFSYTPAYLSIERAGFNKYLSHIDKALLQKVSFDNQRNTANFRDLYLFKKQILRLAFDSTAASHGINLKSIDRNVLAYALYSVLRDKTQVRDWAKWPDKYRLADIYQIIEQDVELHDEIKFYIYVQQTMGNQWKELAEYADSKGIYLVMDKPIYPSQNSSEVWAHQDLFYLNKDGSLKFVSGCKSPRDPFGEQRWGHAVYRFREKPKEVVDYMLKTISFLSWTSKIIRIDHTIALIWKYYVINDKNKKGRHLPAIRDKFFSRLLERFPEVFFIAEDLGLVDEKQIDRPLIKYGIPGMRTLQGCNYSRFYDLNKYPELSIAFTANHDTSSLPFWWIKLRDMMRELYYHQKPELLEMDFEQQIWALIEMVFSTKSIIASVSLRDILFDMRRFNSPGEMNDTNWRMRMTLDLEAIDFSNINSIIKSTGRLK